MVRHTRIVSVVALLGAAVLTGSCASDRWAPTGIAVNAARQPKPAPTGLLACTPLPSTTLIQTVGPEGGTMLIGPHVFVIPPGALERRVKITAKIGKGSVNAVQFSPSGLTFQTPAYLILSYANCTTVDAFKKVAYTTDQLGIIEYVQSYDDYAAQKVTGRVDHFSVFAVAW